MSSRFKKKHLDDLEAIHLPPVAIELNPPDPELVVDLFNRLALDPPKDATLAEPFESAVLEGRRALLQLTAAPAARDPRAAVEPPLAAVSAALLSLGDLRAADDDFPSAARSYLLAMKTAPADHRPSLRLGKLMRRNPGDRLLALYHLRRAEELSPEDPEILFEKALCRMLIRDILGGFVDLDRLIRLLPRPEETFLKFVHAMTAEGLLNFALVLIHHNRDHECVAIPVDPAEVEELLGPCAPYIHHYGFRGANYAFEEGIREVARLFLEGAFDDALVALAELAEGAGAGEPELSAYRGLLLEAKKDGAAALREYETYLTGAADSPVTPVIRSRFDELASRLLDAKVRVAPVPARKALLFIDKSRLFDAILSLDDDRVIEERLQIDPGVHEMRVSFLGTSRMLTGLFQEGRSYRLALDGDDRDFTCRFEEALPYRLTARDAAGSADGGDGANAAQEAGASPEPLRVDSIAARLNGFAAPPPVAPLFPEPLLPPEPCADLAQDATPKADRRASGGGSIKRRRRSDRDDQLLLSAL